MREDRTPEAPEEARRNLQIAPGAAVFMAITVHIKPSTGAKFSVDVDVSQTVLELKEKLAEKTEIPTPQQRLIYKGRQAADDP